MFRSVEGESLTNPNSTSQIVEMASYPEGGVGGKGAMANSRERPLLESVSKSLVLL